MITPRILAPEEIERVRDAGGPLAEIPDLSALKDQKTIVVVEHDGRIVAYWVAFYALHCEPLWIREEYRTNPGVNRGLLDQMAEIVVRSGEPAAFAILEPGATHLELAGRLGFARTPGDLYYVTVPTLAEPVGG